MFPTKEYMVRRLLESVSGMGNRKVVAFGSNKNDISLMNWADLSYATADATPEAKAVADYRAPGTPWGRRGADHFAFV